MKKAVSILLIAILVLAALTGCGGGGGGGDTEGEGALKVLKVGASPTPHGEILGYAKELLAEQGVDLQITEFQDYVLPNMAVDSGDIDANYFQHQAYLDSFNEENELDLVTVAKIHYEPYGIYAGKTGSLDQLTKGSQVAVPNDPSNEARALLLLEQEGLIKLNPDAGVGATILDITENPLELDIKELEAAMIPKALQDVDVAVINGNYAIGAGLNVATDALAVEAADSLAADTYTNVLCVKAGNEGNAEVKALAEVLCSEEMRKFIEETYEGAVVPVF